MAITVEHIQNFQEILFENKEQIPNGIYVQLMDSLKDSFKDSSQLIELTYMIIRPHIIKVDNNLNIGINSHDNKVLKKIVKIEGNYEKSLFVEPFVPFMNKNLFQDVLSYDINVRHEEYIRVSPNQDDDDLLSDDEDDHRTIHTTKIYEVHPQSLILSFKKI
jgi:hypothetical protein